MTEAARAIFLSYASQDAAVAGRIGDALREAGLEVWFDQSELRGGDAWDQLIPRPMSSRCWTRGSRRPARRPSSRRRLAVLIQ